MTIDITTIAADTRERAWDALLSALSERMAAAFAQHREQLDAAGLFLNARDLRHQLEEVLEDARGES